MRRLVARLLDPFISGALFMLGLILAGFVALGIGWNGAADTLNVSSQVSFTVSAGFGGTALILAGIGLLGSHLSRRDEALARDKLDNVLRKVIDLLDSLPDP